MSKNLNAKNGMEKFNFSIPFLFLYLNTKPMPSRTLFWRVPLPKMGL
jgi:hypothetical protein